MYIDMAVCYDGSVMCLNIIGDEDLLALVACWCDFIGLFCGNIRKDSGVSCLPEIVPVEVEFRRGKRVDEFGFPLSCASKTTSFSVGAGSPEGSKIIFMER